MQVVGILGMIAALASCTSQQPSVNESSPDTYSTADMNDPYDPANPLAQIIPVSAMRGLDANLRIVDPEALAESLTAAGLDPAQVEALRNERVDLETYMSLTRLEVDCLRSQGVTVDDPTVGTFEYGMRMPTYGFDPIVAGLSEDQVSGMQIECQNAFTGAYQTIYESYELPSSEERSARDRIAANAYIECARGLGLVPPIDEVTSAADLDIFFTWFATPETDIACSFNP